MTTAIRMLIADDDAVALGMCVESILSDESDLKVVLATTPKQCLNHATNGHFDIVMLDISFTQGGREGLDLIKDIRSLQSHADIIMLSSIDDRAVKLKAIGNGANNYVVKGLGGEVQEIISGIKDAIATRKFKTKSADDGMQHAEKQGATSLSEKMRKVFSLASIARSTNQNVLITGPTGVGKDVIARSISRQSQGIPFKAINCGAISPTLIESELFGSTKGSYTSANRDREGLFQAANGGDIFLDEIATLPMAAQTALLRVLQNGEIRRLGSTEIEKVSVRVIAATNEDLLAAIREGRFREDIWARINAIHIEIPSLAERPEDIKPIIERALKTSDRPHVTLKADCLAFLEAYHWPQNVRQLNAVIHSMVTFSTNDTLSIGDIPKEILDDIAVPNIKESVRQERTDMPKFEFSVPQDLSLEQAIRSFEAFFIQSKFKDLSGSKSITSLAAMLRIPRTTLARRMHNLGIQFSSQH